MLKLLYVSAGVLAVAAGQVLAAFLLYRGRGVENWWVSQSDFVTFFVPPLAGYAAHVYLLTCIFQDGWKREAFAFLLSFIMFWIGLFVSINVYGS